MKFLETFLIAVMILIVTMFGGYMGTLLAKDKMCEVESRDYFYRSPIQPNSEVIIDV